MGSLREKMRAKNSHAWAPLTQQMRLIINSFQNGSSVKGESNQNVKFLSSSK